MKKLHLFFFNLSDIKKVLIDQIVDLFYDSLNAYETELFWIILNTGIKSILLIKVIYYYSKWSRKKSVLM